MKKRTRAAAGVLAVMLACGAVTLGNTEAAGIGNRGQNESAEDQKTLSRQSASISDQMAAELVILRSAEQQSPQTEQTDSAAEADKEGISLSPYANVLVGPKEIDPSAGAERLLGVQNTNDLEALEQYI